MSKQLKVYPEKNTEEKQLRRMIVRLAKTDPFKGSVLIKNEIFGADVWKKRGCSGK